MERTIFRSIFWEAVEHRETPSPAQKGQVKPKPLTGRLQSPPLWAIPRSTCCCPMEEMVEAVEMVEADKVFSEKVTIIPLTFCNPTHPLITIHGDLHSLEPPPQTIWEIASMMVSSLAKTWGLMGLQYKGRCKDTGKLFWICTPVLSNGGLKGFCDHKQSVVKIFVRNRNTSPKRGKDHFTLISTKTPSYWAPTQLLLLIHSSFTILYTP